MNHKWFVLGVLVLAVAACSQNKDPSTTSANVSKIQLSGTVSNGPVVLAKAGLHTRAKFSNNVANADVSLIKKYASGTTEVVATTTTDANGKYAFDNVDSAVTGTGADTDYVYEIKVTSGTTELSSPVAPTGDTVADVNPATDIAEKILSDVVDVPGVDKEALPSAEMVENARELVSSNIDNLSKSIKLPDATTTNSSKVVAAANGVASTGGNAEMSYKVYQFRSELLSLVASSTSTAAQLTGYVKRLTREACGQKQNFNALSYVAAEAVATALKSKTQYDVASIVAAYNAKNKSDPDIVEANAISNFKTALTNIETNLASATGVIADFTAEQELVFYAMRELTAATFASTTKLDADQAVVFLMHAVANGNAMNLCQVKSDVLTAAIGEFTKDTSLASAKIAEVQIYNDSGFGCNGSGLGHFRAEVDVYSPSANINSVTVSSSDTTALTSGSVNLNLNGQRYTSTADGVCVKIGQSVTYTITANLSDGSTAQTTVTRNHPQVPEAQASYNNVALSKNQSAPSVVTELRPTISWSAPSDVIKTIVGAPATSQVKYTYEFSYINIAQNPVGPVGQCSSVTSGGALYSVSSFMPSVDCDPGACAISSGIAANNLQCRINIQTYLVDEADRLLGQAAGNFTFYCVDTNADGLCSN